jgi:tetratricopeptide (TPR) repeat protein
MNILLLTLALIALAVCLVGAVILLRRNVDARANERRDEAERRAAEQADPATAPTAALPARQRWYTTVAERPLYRNGVIAALLALLVLGTWLIVSGLGSQNTTRFVVLVAPFEDGGDGGTGRNVATTLVDEIRSRSSGAIDVSLAPSRPESPQAALELAAERGADLLIYGSVGPGAMLDSPSLAPRLIYLPSRAYAPNGWDGYLGRFAMPRSFAVAREPINGQAVLAPLVLALYDYARGAPDLAYEQLGALQTNYPGLHPALPQAIRGNVLWARTSYGEAAEAYRQALAANPDEPALLANNLGAILMDANDPGALAAFQEAVRLLEQRDLGELRYNLALLALREGRSADAVVALEQARNLLTPRAPMLIDLARAYRETGRLQDAAATLAEARRQASADYRAVAPAYRQMLTARIAAALDEQQALLDLANELAIQGPLLWELEAAPTIAADLLSGLRQRIGRATDASAREVGQWRRRATSDGAARPGSGLTATGQSARAELNADRQRFYLAVIETELLRARGTQNGSNVNALFGRNNTGNPAATLEELQRRYPDSALIANALGRARRVAGNLDTADIAYDQTIRLAPQAPEGYFGRGMVAQARGDLPRAVELFNQALERNGAFFPSHYALAVLADEQRDYAAAVVQRRQLYALRPTAASAVALAQALRLSGPAGFVEAEQVLITLSTSDGDAAIELARLYNDAGRPDAAVNAYLLALQVSPGSSAAAFELGETYAARGNYAEAERLLTQALRADTGNVEARLALADLYQGPLEDPQRAEREYRQALSEGVNDVEELTKIGEAALAVGNTGQAIDAFTDAVALDPNNALLHHRLGQAYFRANRLPAAAEQENTALGLTGDPQLQAEALTTLGDVARLSGDLAGATANYARALQLNPNLIAPELGLGLVAVGQGNWGVAASYFQTAVAKPGGNDDPMAQFWLGEARLRQGDTFGAATAYTRALELQTTFPEAQLGLAQLQYSQGDLQAALDTVGVAVRERPAYAEALLFQGKLLQELGRTQEAETAYSASIRANGAIAETHYRRGIIELQSERYDDAVRDLRRATQLQPNFPEAFYWLGRAYYAEGRLDLALQALQQAVALNGSYVEAIFYTGLVFEDLGRTAEAVSAFQTVLAIEPTGSFAEESRVNIDRLT